MPSPYQSTQTVNYPITQGINDLADTIMKFHTLQQNIRHQQAQDKREEMLNMLTQEQVKNLQEGRKRQAQLEKSLQAIPQTERVPATEELKQEGLPAVQDILKEQNPEAYQEMTKEQPRSSEAYRGDVAKALLQSGKIDEFLKMIKPDMTGATFVGYDPQTGQPQFALPRQGKVVTGTQQGTPGPLAAKTQQKHNQYNDFYAGMKQANPNMSDMDIAKAWGNVQMNIQKNRYLPYVQIPGLPGFSLNRRTNTIERSQMPQGITPQWITGQQANWKLYTNAQVQGQTRFIDTLIGDPDNAIPGTIGIALNLQNQLVNEVGESNIPVINKQWINSQRKIGGNTVAAQYANTLYNIARESARAAAGTGSQVTDAQTQQEMDKLYPGYTLDQMAGVLNNEKRVLLMRKHALLAGTAGDMGNWQDVETKYMGDAFGAEPQLSEFGKAFEALDKKQRGGKKSKGKLNDPAIARMYLQRAGGDKQRARQLAQQDGYEL